MHHTIMLNQVDGNLKKCVWYANLRVGRASYANLHITLKSALVWVWLVIDWKSSSHSSHNSMGTSLDISMHISGNISVYQMLQANCESQIQVPFSVVVCWYHMYLRILHRLFIYLIQPLEWIMHSRFTVGGSGCGFRSYNMYKMAHNFGCRR